MKPSSIGLLCLSLLCLALHTTQAQTPPKVFICHYFGKAVKNTDICSSLQTQAYMSTGRAEKVVKKITESMNLSRNPFKMIECPETDNCYATLIEGVPHIIYDKNFLSRVEQITSKDWAAISILAHEVGHLVYYHPTNNQGSQHKKELEADEFSGACLYRMGATLEEAQLAMNHFQQETWTSTHPPRSQRLAAIAKGWEEEKRKDTRYTAETPQENSIIPKPQDPLELSTIEPEVTNKSVQLGCISGNCSNGTGYFIHKTQGSYKGMWKNGKRHGFGIHYYADGSKMYEGEYQNGVRHGRGVFYFRDGEYFAGKFDNDKMTELGNFILLEENVYPEVELQYIYSNGKTEDIIVKNH
jgi:hypothetical protein